MGYLTNKVDSLEVDFFFLKEKKKNTLGDHIYISGIQRNKGNPAIKTTDYIYFLVCAGLLLVKTFLFFISLESSETLLEK